VRARHSLASAGVGLVALFALSAASCTSAKHPRSAADVAVAEAEWSQQVREQISDHWFPWDIVRVAKSAGPSAPQPTTVLRIAVPADGKAPSPQIMGSSGVPALDEAAVAAVAAALPLPAPPPERLSADGSLVFVLGFRVVTSEDASGPSVDQKKEPFAVITASLDSKDFGVADRADVQSTVASHRREVLTCRDRHRSETGAPADGEVMVEFVITESGSVRRPVVVKARGLTRPFEGCLLRTMSLWTFQRPAGGPVKVVFPFRFWPGQGVGAELEAGRRLPALRNTNQKDDAVMKDGLR
jgi:TonB family protein